MTPYLLGPVAPDLFRSDKQSRSGGTTSCKYTQYVKVHDISTEVTQVESAWQALVSELGKQEMPSFSGWEVQDASSFAGMLGWDSLEVILPNSSHQR